MPDLTTAQLESAVEYNIWAAEEVFEDKGLPARFLEDYHAPLGNACWAPSSPEFAAATANFQADHDLVVDGKLGTKTLGTIGRAYPITLSEADKNPSRGGGQPLLLTPEVKSKLVQYTVAFEGGKKNPYNGQNKDAEYEGYFDQPRTKNGKRLSPSERAKQPNHKPHRASKFHPSGGFHIGLSWGAWQFAQEPGSLGALLRFMRSKHPELFREVFGVHSDQLVTTTTATNRRTGKFSARTQKVGGAFLWHEPWLSRFTKAASCEEFRECQRLWVSRQFLDKVLPLAEEYNMDSAGAIAVLFDICVQFGLGGLKRYVSRANLTPGDPFDPGTIRKVIAALPKSHHKRRLHILEAAGQDERYTW